MDQMDTLEQRSIIIETKTSLEEPAGARQPEKESERTLRPRRLCYTETRGHRSQQGPQRNSDIMALLAGTRGCQRREQRKAGV